MLTYVKVLLHHLDLALFGTLLQSVLCKLENDLYHLETQEWYKFKYVQRAHCPGWIHLIMRAVVPCSYLVSYHSFPFHWISKKAWHKHVTRYSCNFHRSHNLCINTILLTAC